MSPENTKRLILKTGDIAYPDGAIAQIIQLTHEQPYLVQLIGYILIRTFNRGDSTITLSANNHPVFNTDDINQLVHSPEFYTIGNAYFQGVWLQALHGEPPGQATILKQLVSQAMSQEQLVHSTHLTPQAVEKALRRLQSHDVLSCHHGYFAHTVDLMRRWVKSKQLKDI